MEHASDWAAVIVAACALGISIWQGLVTRTHARRSVRPHLVWCENKVVTDSGVCFTVSISNYGIGPAVIQDRYFLLGGAKYAPPDADADTVEELVRQVLQDKLPYRLLVHGLPGTKSAIPQGGNHVIAEIFFPEGHAGTIKTVRHYLHEVEFVVEYSSIYGEKFTFRTD